MSPKIFTTAILVGMMAFSLAAHADSGELFQAKENAQESALNFARCSGVYAAVSEVHAATNSPALAKTTKETSNGAWLASAYIMFSTGIIPDWKKAMTYAENTASSEKLSYMASFEKDADPNKAVGELTDAMKECNKFGELQEKLVQEARIRLYSQNAEEER